MTRMGGISVHCSIRLSNLPDTISLRLIKVYTNPCTISAFDAAILVCVSFYIMLILDVDSAFIDVLEQGFWAMVPHLLQQCLTFMHVNLHVAVFHHALTNKPIDQSVPFLKNWIPYAGGVV